MTDLRSLLIDCRIELRKLSRDFQKTELCERLDLAIQAQANAKAAPASAPSAIWVAMMPSFTWPPCALRRLVLLKHVWCHPTDSVSPGARNLPIATFQQLLAPAQSIFESLTFQG